MKREVAPLNDRFPMFLQHLRITLCGGRKLCKYLDGNVDGGKVKTSAIRNAICG